jgi:DNA-directed RNA polymerase
LLDSFDLAAENFIKADLRVGKDFGLGATQGAAVIIRKHFAQATAVVVSKLETEARRGVVQVVDLIRNLDPELVALVALQGCLSSITREDPLRKTYFYLGSLIGTELWAQKLQEFDPKVASHLEGIARRRNSSVTYRRTAMRSMAALKGFRHTAWSNADQLSAGRWLVEVALAVDEVFKLEPHRGMSDPYLTITAEALEYSQEMVAMLMVRRPVPLPRFSPPQAWQGLRLRVPCGERQYDIPLVRGEKRKLVHRWLRKSLAEGRLQPVMDSLSRVQSTAWRLNPQMASMASWAFTNGVSLKKFPPRDDIPMPQGKMPEDQWVALTEDQQRAYRRDLAGKAKKNRGFVGQRETLKHDIETARYILDNGNQFWTPMNLDYRGRVYAICHFNFQRLDYVRAMFEFHEGKPLGPEGLYWLMIHLANVGDFEKTSKKPFVDRVAWVKANEHIIMEIACDPTEALTWTEADKPFLFLAACLEYAAAIESGNPSTFVSHLPVAVDGSCSGLQHYAAMTRCEATAPLVNLTPSDTVADIYQTVADKVRLRAEQMDTPVAQACLAAGIDRKLVKRNVMTWGYSSKKFGMAKQLMTDTMSPLKDKVVMGELEAHPFAIEGEDWEGKDAAMFLAGLTFDCIEQTVERPAVAMRFLQGVARTLAHEGQPVVWHTPLGFPVVLHYPVQSIKRVRLFLQDHGVTIDTRVSVAEDQDGINKTKAAGAVSPGFVHSYDACHLQMVVNDCAQAGIHNIALVHDSFGSHAGSLGLLRRVILETFHRLYSENDVLANILEEASAMLTSNHHRLPPLPEMGSYDINEVLNATYAFA